LQLWLLSSFFFFFFLFFLAYSNGILSGAKFTLRPPSLAFSYIGSVTVRHWSSGRQPNSAAWYKEWNYGTFAPRFFQQRAPPIFRGRPSRWAQAHILVVDIMLFSHKEQNFITYRVSRRRREMYCGHPRLCVCLSVCLFAAACLHCCTDLDVTWESGRRYPLVVHYWAYLQSLHGLRCYGNIT